MSRYGKTDAAWENYIEALEAEAQKRGLKDLLGAVLTWAARSHHYDEMVELFAQGLGMPAFEDYFRPERPSPY